MPASDLIGISNPCLPQFFITLKPGTVTPVIKDPYRSGKNEFRKDKSAILFLPQFNLKIHY